MSPEQAKGELVDERTDIFSFGVVIYEMLTGRAPFAGDSMSETFANLINAEPQPLSNLAANVPDQLQRIVAKTLRKTKDERYPTMKDVLTDLKDLEGEAHLNRSPSAHANGRGATTKTVGHAVGTAFTSADTAGDVATARPTSSVEYLMSMIKRHKRGALLTAAAVFIAIAAVVYFSYPTSSGERDRFGGGVALCKRERRSQHRIPLGRNQRQHHQQTLATAQPESQLAQLGLALQGTADRPAGGWARAECSGGVDRQNDTTRRRYDHQRRVGGRERQPPAVGRAI